MGAQEGIVNETNEIYGGVYEKEEKRDIIRGVASSRDKAKTKAMKPHTVRLSRFLIDEATARKDRRLSSTLP